MQTATLITKPHYPILDGLRGVAAILVVLFHFMEPHFSSYASNYLHHGYLAVDFFFLLSGFVVGYAYDDRWNQMNILTFFKIRLIRLHPMVVFAVLLGAVCYWFDPFSDGHQNIGFLKLIGVTFISFTLLPSPDIRGWGETHSLVGPAWSLLQEYIANVLYGLLGKKLSKILLWILVIISGIILTIVAVKRGDIATGWGFDNFWIAVVRMMFPFFAGLLLFRMGKLIHIQWAFTLCSLTLIVLFFLPYFKYNGLYESVCIIVAFPIIVAVGAGGQIKGRTAKICDFFGKISYPIYIIHYPIIYLYIDWFFKVKPGPKQYIPIAAGLFVLMILIAYGSLKLYDTPIRLWLKKKILQA